MNKIPFIIFLCVIGFVSTPSCSTSSANSSGIQKSNFFKYTSKETDFDIVLDPTESDFFIGHTGGGMINCTKDETNCWIVENYVLLSNNKGEFKKEFLGSIDSENLGATYFFTMMKNGR